MIEDTTCSEAARARSAAAVWGMLSRALLRPDAALAADILEGTFEKNLADLLDASSSSELAAALDALAHMARNEGGSTADELRLSLEVDFNRLFVGPGKLLAPPYESYYASLALDGRDGRLRTSEELAARRAYETSGYAMPSEFVELPDHIAVELNYLALLAYDEACAWKDGNKDRALGLRTAGDAFCAEHPARWIAALSERVDAGARMAFYPAITRIARVLMS